MRDKGGSEGERKGGGRCSFIFPPNVSNLKGMMFIKEIGKMELVFLAFSSFTFSPFFLSKQSVKMIKIIVLEK